jgi:formylglycine-generating enzyme
MAHVVDGVIGIRLFFGLALALCAGLEGCKPRVGLRPGLHDQRPPGAEPQPAPPPAAAPSCDGSPISAQFLLAGWDVERRRALADRIAQGPVVAVNYRAEGCTVWLDVIEDCKVSLEYKTREKRDTREQKARDRTELFQHLPLGAVQLFTRIDRGEAIVVEASVLGIRELPSSPAINRSRVSGAGCVRATHLITAAQMGGERLRSDTARKSELLSALGTVDGCKVTCTPIPIALTLLPIEGLPAAPEPDMIEIAPGPFVRGSADGAPDEKPAREIALHAFAIDRTEVTAAAYDACAAQGACTPAGRGERCTSGVLGKERHPINCISWAQAEAYCRFVGKRLPTEAEWERVARSSEGRVFVWGPSWPPPPQTDNFADDAARADKPYWNTIASYDDGYSTTAPVDAFPKGASKEGVLGLGGNVSEWTADWYEAAYYAASSDKEPVGPSKGKARVLRGGSFGAAKEKELRATKRFFYFPEQTSAYFGVRCARDLAQR